jgi:glutathione S-transferase
MKIYYHPVSTTSRTVMLCAQECGINADFQVVDLMTGEHMKPPYSDLNPNCLVPMVDDGGFLLTESSAILKYIAEKAKCAAYPTDLQARAKVNEMMDWVNSNLYKDLGYGLVYPQLFPWHKRPTDELQAGTLAWHKQKSQAWLKLLDEKLLGPDKTYLCGSSITIADYFAVPIIGLGELIGCDFAPYPNVRRWMNRMKALPSWSKVNEVYDGFAASLKGQRFVTF